jgi:hypothetical protein
MTGLGIGHCVGSTKSNIALDIIDRLNLLRGGQLDTVARAVMNMHGMVCGQCCLDVVL